MRKMLRLDWRAPSINRIEDDSLGSDTSHVNLYLLRGKYHIEVAEQEGIYFRRYAGESVNAQGYGFPLSAKPFDVSKAIAALRCDARERGETLRFCACDERQRKAVDEVCAIHWKSCAGDSDYIYKRESLAKLSGRKLHRKKNHVNHFWRLYPEAAYFPLTTDRLPDALRVAKQWMDEHGAEEKTAQEEWSSIQEAAAHWEQLGMMGGVLYAGGDPVAMTMASVLSSKCIDVHFEKATGVFAADGAFSVVNQCFAASEEASAYIYINREEDLGVAGLRKAKESYQPCLKLEKFYGSV